MKLEYWFENYNLVFDKSIFILFTKISNYLFIKFKYFINLFVDAESLYLVSRILKESAFTSFKLAVDLTAVDFYYKINRFKLFYIFLNLYNNKKVSISTLPINSMLISSISLLYKSLNWAEREVWDMFGLFFINNSNLRRILNDYGFSGYPLRKDFPLTGFVELYFNNSIFEICYRPVQLAQELRFFNFSSCW
jgi:NADH:ubiquinone oxidoreductase subunit C